MTSPTQRLYSHLQNKVTPLQLQKILGEEVAEALVSYYRFQADESFEFNSSKTLVEALGNTAFTNKSFVHHLILDWLDAPEIEALLKNLNLRRQLAHILEQKENNDFVHSETREEADLHFRIR